MRLHRVDTVTLASGVLVAQGKRRLPQEQAVQQVQNNNNEW